MRLTERSTSSTFGQCIFSEQARHMPRLFRHQNHCSSTSGSVMSTVLVLRDYQKDVARVNFIVVPDHAGTPGTGLLLILGLSTQRKHGQRFNVGQTSITRMILPISLTYCRFIEGNRAGGRLLMM